MNHYLAVFFTLTGSNWIVGILVVLSGGLFALTGWFIYRIQHFLRGKIGKRGFPRLVLIAAGLWALFMASYTVGRLLSEVDARIVAREMTTGQRPVVIYTVRNSHGKIDTFVGGGTEASLPGQLSIGSYITKRKWQLGYTLNGKWVSDFSVTFYSIIFALGANLLILGIFRAVQQYRPTT